MRRSLGVEISNSHDLIESLRAHCARIHPERAADRARNSLHPLQSANTHGLSGISNLLELRANTDRDFVAVNFHLVKIAAARMNHHAANPTIPDEQVRATTDYKNGKIFLPAKADQLGKSLFVARLNPKLCRPANAQSGVFRERLIEADVALLTDDRF